MLQRASEGRGGSSWKLLTFAEAPSCHIDVSTMEHAIRRSQLPKILVDQCYLRDFIG